MAKIIEKLKRLFTMTPEQIAYAENELRFIFGMKKPGVPRITLLKQISDVNIPKIDQVIDELKTEGVLIETHEHGITYYALSERERERQAKSG
jgi:hypothetical protein